MHLPVLVLPSPARQKIPNDLSARLGGAWGTIPEQKRALLPSLNHVTGTPLETKVAKNSLRRFSDPMG